MLTERPPLGVALVALLTAAYGLGHLGAIVEWPGGPDSGFAFAAGVLCLTLAILLWQRKALAWIGGLTLYALWALEGAVGLAVGGGELEYLPVTLVGAFVVGYLLFTRDAFDRTEIASRPEPASMPGDR